LMLRFQSLWIVENSRFNLVFDKSNQIFCKISKVV
jgi:hypothetical protein